MKKLSSLILINLLISFVYSIFKNFEEFSFIDCSFVIGMFYFMFGILCFVWEKGFFNITIYSFNKISQRLHRQRGVLVDEADLELKDYLNRQNYFSYTTSLLVSGILISSLTTIIGFNQYL